MSKNISDAVPDKIFETFSSEAIRYLSGISDEPARVFGLRYLDFLRSKLNANSDKATRCQHISSPAQSLIRSELNRMFYIHFGWKPEKRTR